MRNTHPEGHRPETCPTCAPYVGSEAYRRGVARAEAMHPQKVTGS